MRRTTVLLAAGTVTLALGLSACGGSSDNTDAKSPTTTDNVPTQADTTSLPGYTLSPESVGTTASAPTYAKGAAASDLTSQVTSFAAAADKYIKAGHTSFADDDNMLDPTKFLDSVGWHAPAGMTVARIDTDNQSGVTYEVCLAKDSGAWVVYDSKQHKVISSGPQGQACGGM